MKGKKSFYLPVLGFVLRLSTRGEYVSGPEGSVDSIKAIIIVVAFIGEFYKTGHIET